MRLITRPLFLILMLALVACRNAPIKAAPPSVVVSSGVRYVPLSHIARLYSMKLTSSSGKLRLKNKWNTIEVEENSRRCWVNGAMVWLQHPARKVSHQWSIREVDFKKTIDPIMRAYSHVPSRPPRVVMLDPGHGGKDTGAIGERRVYEKLVVMDISKRVEAHLNKSGLKVKFTRRDDSYPTLQQRCDMAAKAGADLFVSIHADAVGDKRAHGVGTFVATTAGNRSTNDYGSTKKTDLSASAGNAHDAANAVLGYSIHSNLLKKWPRSDRGLRRARYYVIRNAPCPAALVECAFLSNPEEESLLIEAKNRDIVAKGIANGIIAYVTQVNRAVKK